VVLPVGIAAGSRCLAPPASAGVLCASEDEVDAKSYLCVVRAPESDTPGGFVLQRVVGEENIPCLAAFTVLLSVWQDGDIAYPHGIKDESLEPLKERDDNNGLMAVLTRQLKTIPAADGLSVWDLLTAACERKGCQNVVNQYFSCIPGIAGALGDGSCEISVYLDEDGLKMRLQYYYKQPKADIHGALCALGEGLGGTMEGLGCLLHASTVNGDSCLTLVVPAIAPPGVCAWSTGWGAPTAAPLCAAMSSAASSQ